MSQVRGEERSAAAGRAGRYVAQLEGYRAFIPKPLPPDPPLDVDPEMLGLLSEADIALGRLDGTADVLPNPDLFVAMYVRKEAVLSSQIEGTQASLVELLDFEAAAPRRTVRSDVLEVLNYVAALNHAIDRVGDLPLSLRLLREVHNVLMTGVRGGGRYRGEFRTTQNWIGPPGAGPDDAVFVPPPPSQLMGALGHFETFLHTRNGMPPLVHAGLAHAPVRNDSPLCRRKRQDGPAADDLSPDPSRGAGQTPAVSVVLPERAPPAIRRRVCNEVRDEGAWEDWLRFFLRGVAEVAREATATAKDVLAMQALHGDLALTHTSGNPRASDFVDVLMRRPVITVNQAADELHVSYPTANALISKFEAIDLLRETTGQARNRRYRYQPYVDLLGQRSPAM